jgi:hypothetical protein
MAAGYAHASYSTLLRIAPSWRDVIQQTDERAELPSSNLGFYPESHGKGVQFLVDGRGLSNKPGPGTLMFPQQSFHSYPH